MRNNLVMNYSKKRRGCKRKQAQITCDDTTQLKRACLFCNSCEDDEVNFGAMLEKEDVTVHYFCMLLSSGLCQNTKIKDPNSIFGFRLIDIKKELQRGSRLKCCYCHNKGATIGCCISSCRKAFHLRCGRENGTMHQFFDSFKSYCDSHRRDQEIPKGLNKKSNTCSICLCTIKSFATCNTLFSPCCQKNYFHRQCLQQYAMSAGMHYFKCPLCNCIKDFQSVMIEYGIYIPDQDASWEKEPNAFEELLQRHSTCDVVHCVCPQGRMLNLDSGKYELLLCGWCGAYGSHRACHGLVWRDSHFVCWDCAEISDQADKKRVREQTPDSTHSKCKLRMLRSSLSQQHHDQQSSSSSRMHRSFEEPQSLMSKRI